jgi:hypothetical protein
MPTRLSLALALGAAAGLLAAAPALADNNYFVAAPAPDSAGSCSLLAGNAYGCPTLRAAVDAANASPDTDVIAVQDGTYQLSSPLTLSASVAITGSGARRTTIEPSGSRAFIVNPSITVGLSLMTIRGGTAATADGGNIANAGDLSLSYMRLTGGSAAHGGGLANSGSGASVVISQSLVDHNSASIGGGGIANLGADQADLTIFASTVALNTGGGVSSGVNASDSVSLVQSTIARNTGTGLAVPFGTANSFGSIIANNGTNCGAPPPTDSGGNIEDTVACGFGAGGSNRDPGLSADLVNAGGETDVLTIPANSPAIGIVQPCSFPVDQRGGQRVNDASEACDAGAFEQAVVVDQPPTPTPTPTPVPPAPTPVATPEPQKSVAGQVVEGRILVKKPGSKTFVALDPGQPIPVGSTVDATQGTISVTALLKKGGKPDKANFFDGIFKISQTKTTTDLNLNQALASCKKGKAGSAAKKPKSRKLWGDGSGSFRTRGQYSSATVRGTKWLVQDSCAGTLTKVSKGAVTVRDNVKRKTVVLRAGKQYLARPRK